MSDAEFAYLRERASRGDEDAAAQLVELAGEREDAYELRLLAESGSTDEMDQRVQLATETGDIDELRRLEAAAIEMQPRCWTNSTRRIRPTTAHERAPRHELRATGVTQGGHGAEVPGLIRC